MMLTYRVRTYPTRRQHAWLAECLDHTRDLYNAALAERIGCYEKTGRTITLGEQGKALTFLRQDAKYARFPRRLQKWTLNLVEAAYRAMFTRHNKGDKLGRPRFRGREFWKTVGWDSPIEFSMRNRGLYRIKSLGGTLRLRPDRLLPPFESCKAITMTRAGSRWFANLTYEVADRAPCALPRCPVGIDIGLRTLAVTSDGAKFDVVRPYREAEAELRQASRVLTRRRKGSKRRQKARERLRRLHARIQRRRAAELHALSARLVRHHDAVAVEDLNLQGLNRSGGSGRQGRGIRKSWRDRAPGLLLDQLEWKCQRDGRLFKRVDPRGTTIDCAACGAAVPKPLKQRQHICTACNDVRDRDENAALNIRNRAGWGPGGANLRVRSAAVRSASMGDCLENTAAATLPDHGGVAFNGPTSFTNATQGESVAAEVNRGRHSQREAWSFLPLRAEVNRAPVEPR